MDNVYKVNCTSCLFFFSQGVFAWIHKNRKESSYTSSSNIGSFIQMYSYLLIISIQ